MFHLCESVHCARGAVVWRTSVQAGPGVWGANVSEARCLPLASCRDQSRDCALWPPGVCRVGVSIACTLYVRFVSIKSCSHHIAYARYTPAHHTSGITHITHHA
eukprot:4006117-Prymnesium_polylepis.1